MEDYTQLLIIGVCLFLLIAVKRRITKLIFRLGIIALLIWGGYWFYTQNPSLFNF